MLVLFFCIFSRGQNVHCLNSWTPCNKSQIFQSHLYGFLSDHILHILFCVDFIVLDNKYDQYLQNVQFGKVTGQHGQYGW